MQLGACPRHPAGHLALLSTAELGARGEELAVAYLKQKGYKLLARNVRTRFGELDLVAQDGPEVVFVEVKTRVDVASMPEESVHSSKVGRVTRLAEAYLAERGKEESMWRIDVVAIIVDRSGKLQRLEHLPNAVY